MVKVIHAADFHLDSPFEALPPEKARQRRSEQRECVMALRDLALETDAELVLLAGDLFDSENAFYETSQMLREVFAEIPARVFIAPGNHDCCAPGSPYRGIVWPENVHIFRSSRVECVELPDLGCRVFGAAFTGPSVHRSLLEGFEAPQDGLVNLMVLHGDTAAVTDSYDPIDKADIAASKLDYLALGHIHSFSGILRAGDTDYAYPGCPEGRGFDETGEKGVIAGTVDKGRTDLRFVPLGRRKYVEASVDYEVLLRGEAMPDAAEKDILRLTLTGQRDGETDRERVMALLEDRYFHLVLRDRTTRRRDIWEQAYEDSLRGMFLRDLRETYEAAGEDKRPVIELAARYALAAMDNGEVPQL